MNYQDALRQYKGRTGTPTLMETNPLLKKKGVGLKSVFIVKDIAIDGEGNVRLNIESTNIVGAQVRELVYADYLNLSNVGRTITQDENCTELTLKEAEDICGWTNINLGVSIYKNRIINRGIQYVRVYEAEVAYYGVQIGEYTCQGKLTNISTHSFEGDKYGLREVETLLGHKWPEDKNEVIGREWIVRKETRNTKYFFRVIHWEIVPGHINIGRKNGKERLIELDKAKELESVPDRKLPPTNTTPKPTIRRIKKRQNPSTTEATKVT